MSSDMTGKTVLITGATNGIGKAAALQLAGMGATVIVVGRSREKAEAVVAAIKQAGRGDAWAALADLSSQAAVRGLAEQINREVARLDVLINNAGAVFLKREETVDGIEMTFALNHLSYFLLTKLLLDLLKRSAPARIVNVASEAERGGRLRFDDLQHKQRYFGFGAYGDSKLANIAFTYELARRLTAEGAGVTANAMAPGLVATGYNMNNGLLMRLAMTVIRPFALKPEQGADTVVWLASSPDVEGMTGGYYEKRTPIKSMPQTYLPEVQRRLWVVSEEMVEEESS